MTALSARHLFAPQQCRHVAALVFLAWLLSISPVLAVDDEIDNIPRHPLELRALTHPEEVIEALPREISQAKTANDPRTLALLYLAEANACRVIADWLCQRRASSNAAEAATAAGDPLLIARGLILEGRALIGLQDYTRGEQLLSKAQSQLTLSPLPALSADVKLGFSSLSHALGKHQLAAEYAEEGLRLLGPDVALGMQARLHRNRARALGQLGDQAAARGSLTAGIKAAEQVDDPKLAAELHLESARIANQMGDISGQRKHTTEVLALANQLSNSQLFGQAHEALGLAAAQAKDTQDALNELEIATRSFRALTLERDELRASQTLIGLMLEVGTDTSQLDPLLRRQFELQGKVALRDRAQAADDFESRLKYAQQQLDVLRLEGEAQLADERSRGLEAQSKLNRWVSTLSLVAAVTLAIFFAFQLRAKRRVLKVLADLRRSESRASELLRLSTGLVLLHDLDGQIDLLNPAAAQALHVQDNVTRLGNLRDHVAANDSDILERYLQTLKSTGAASEVVHVAPYSSSARLLRIDGRVAPNTADRPYVIGHATDITAEVREADALRAQTLHDPLTGCLNRRYLAHFAERVSEDNRWAIINIDLDGFKSVNDTFGHEHGDSVLREIAAFLSTHVREGDAVIRVGGDEFLILMPVANGGSLAALVTRLEANKDAAPCRYSLGSALREGTESLAESMLRADAQMYEHRRIARSM